MIEIDIGRGQAMFCEEKLNNSGDLEIELYDALVWMTKQGALNLIKVLNEKFGLDVPAGFAHGGLIHDPAGVKFICAENGYYETTQEQIDKYGTKVLDAINGLDFKEQLQKLIFPTPEPKKQLDWYGINTDPVELTGKIDPPVTIHTVPVNPETGEPYFTISSSGWDDNWSSCEPGPALEFKVEDDNEN